MNHAHYPCSLSPRDVFPGSNREPILASVMK